MILSIEELLGHLHPILVHLPVGILLIGIVLYWLSRKEKFQGLRGSVSIIFGIGALSAIVSCITGYILSDAESYEENLKNWHQWMGISTAIFSIAAYYFSRKSLWGTELKIISGILLGLLVVTGHLGGSLTHGSDYLSKPLVDIWGGSDTVELVFKKPIPDIAEAVVYKDIIHPIFQARCVNCHGEHKQKGKLKLNEPDGILAGGKTGKAIFPGKPEQGELIKRLTLPQRSKDHMPPKGKPQLTENEIALIKWWLADSADFQKKVRLMKQPPQIKPVLLALQKGVDTQAVKLTDVPETPVGPPSEVVLEKLRRRGVVVMPVSLNSHYLSVNFLTAQVEDSSLTLLEKLEPQLIWLNMGSSAITDKGLQSVGKLSNLTKLYLNNTQITDSGLHFLKPLQRLQYLNLVHTNISSGGLEQLSGLKTLKNVFCYQSKILPGQWHQLKKVFPDLNLDTGGYQVTSLVTDTMIYKGPAK